MNIDNYISPEDFFDKYEHYTYEITHYSHRVDLENVVVYDSIRNREYTKVTVDRFLKELSYIDDISDLKMLIDFLVEIGKDDLKLADLEDTDYIVKNATVEGDKLLLGLEYDK
jgi:hypothetical protein